MTEDLKGAQTGCKLFINIEEGFTLSAKRFLTDEFLQMSAALKIAKKITGDIFDSASTKALSLMGDYPYGCQIDYFSYHKKRFYEINNFIALLIEDKNNQKILDVGTSVNTLIIRDLFPGNIVYTMDRVGVEFSEKSPLKLYSVDLNDPDLDDVDLDEKFEVIVFSEILEHLLANPVRVFRFLLRHLSKDGVLILTTPNFFNKAYIQNINEMINPQPIFPESLKRGEENQYHVREYSASELLEFCDAAGGNPIAFIFSSCWDDDLYIPEYIPEYLLKNLVLFAKCK